MMSVSASFGLCPISAGAHQDFKVTYTAQERSFKQQQCDDAAIPQVGRRKVYAADKGKTFLKKPVYAVEMRKCPKGYLQTKRNELETGPEGNQPTEAL